MIWVSLSFLTFVPSRTKVQNDNDKQITRYNTCSKSAMETSEQQKHQKNAIEVVLISFIVIFEHNLHVVLVNTLVDFEQVYTGWVMTFLTSSTYKVIK